jgi:trk system potassium uptake protein
MNYLLGRIPLLLELSINGFFIVVYTLHKANQSTNLLAKLPLVQIFQHALWVIPSVLFVALFSNFIRSRGLEDFIRRYIFSLIIFVPVMITWGDIEFTYWLSAVHLFSSLISFYEKKEVRLPSRPASTSSFLFRLKLQPAQVVLLSFAGWNLLGTLALMLPVSVQPGKSLSFIDAFFMSTSATCVTGLSTISVVDDLSIFGQMVLLVLVQVGGLGIMTLSSSLALIMGRSLQMREQVIMQDVLDTSNSQELLALVVDIIRFTFTIEFVGAMLLTIGFYFEGFEIGESLYYGFFHAISSFCNAGFALWNNSLEDFKFSPIINFTIIGLIILGGIGFSVMKEASWAIRSRVQFRALSVHTKIVLVTNTLLLVFGTLYFFFGEFLHSFQDFNTWEKFQLAFFQSTTTRTAGFNTIALPSMQTHSIYLTILLMFIGASPGSTGGGVKTTTFAVLLQSVTTTLKGKQEVEFFERKVPQQTVVKSIAIFIICLIVVSTGILILVRVEPDKSFLSLFFEAVSAFSTVGLSLGITPFLTTLGKICLIVLMYLGRVGPLTLVVAVGSRVVLPSKVEYPEGKVLIG